jgi:hypothetical protein
MPIWLIALFAYLVLALASAWLLVAALFAGAASDASTNASSTVQPSPARSSPRR